MIKKHVKQFLAGMMLGIGGILPGLSGSALAVVFGIYEELLNTIATLFKDFKRKLLYLLPIGIGAFVGFYGISLLLNSAFARFETELLFLFCGLMAGSMPSLLRQARASVKEWSPKYYIAAVLGLGVSMLLFLVSGQEGAAAQDGITDLSCMAAGAILTAGTLLPGMSTSFILIRLGWYEPLMSAVASVQLVPLLWCAAGCIVCGLTLLWGIRWLIRKIPGWVYHAVAGVVFGTAITSLPFTEISIVNVIVFAVGIGLSVLTIRLGKE